MCLTDVPEFDPEDLHKFSKPVIVRVGQNANFKMPFPPQDSLTVSWCKDGNELKDGGGVKIVKEPNHSRLLLRDCLRTDAGEIKIKLVTPFGVAEATTQLIVLGMQTQRSIMRPYPHGDGTRIFYKKFSLNVELSREIYIKHAYGLYTWKH